VLLFLDWIGLGLDWTEARYMNFFFFVFFLRFCHFRFTPPFPPPSPLLLVDGERLVWQGNLDVREINVASEDGGLVGPKLSGGDQCVRALEKNF
jgi:hypothetical protein